MVDYVSGSDDAISMTSCTDRVLTQLYLSKSYPLRGIIFTIEFNAFFRLIIFRVEMLDVPTPMVYAITIKTRACVLTT